MPKTTIFVISITLLFISVSPQSDFLTEQKRYQRVRSAISEKQDDIEKLLGTKNLTLTNFELLIVAYKDADELILYAKKQQQTEFSVLRKYNICARSGGLGPKSKEGDRQVPEGFYHVDRFNPSSNFYLSLGINYPNASDRKRSKASNFGGDIFIHGSCVTIGCLPMTDDKIKEIYLMAVHAKNNGQVKIPVYLFPFKMTSDNMAIYKSRFQNNKGLLKFWENSKTGYDLFMKSPQNLKFSVTADGEYKF